MKELTLSPKTIECPLCLGKGSLSRIETLERLGMRDFARVAQLSAEEAIRLVLGKEKDAEQSRWAKFDAELARRLTEAAGRHNIELQQLEAEKNQLAARLKGLDETVSGTVDNARQEERLKAEREHQSQLATLTRRVFELEAAGNLADEQRNAELARTKAELEGALASERTKAIDLARLGKDYLEEISTLRERNQELQGEMRKVARIGKKEEMDFAEEARSWPGIWVGEKLARNGDYLVAFADPAGNPLTPFMVIDNKDKATVAETDVRKLVRDAKERKVPVAVLVAREEAQLRPADRRSRWGIEEGIWLLRSTRAWFPRDLEVLRPLFERMRSEGEDFLEKNAALADEVRRTLADLDEIDDSLQRAGTAIDRAQALSAKFRSRLAGLCDTAACAHPAPRAPKRKQTRVIAKNGNGDGNRIQARPLREGSSTLSFS